MPRTQVFETFFLLFSSTRPLESRTSRLSTTTREEGRAVTFQKNVPFSKVAAPVARKHSRTRARRRLRSRVAETREWTTATMFHVNQDVASTTVTRSFEQYRYAIEAGLVSPHDVRRHILPWESATRDSTVSRSSKRYHDHEDAYADEANKENADARCVYLFSNGSQPHRARNPRDMRQTTKSAFWISPCVFFQIAHLRRPPVPDRSEGRRRFRKAARPPGLED